MPERTLTRILDMVYEAPPDRWNRMEFTCDPETFRELRSLDHSGEAVVETRETTGARPTMLGFPVRVRADHAGLSFGPERLRARSH